jgi:hypothetical protein
VKHFLRRTALAAVLAAAVGVANAEDVSVKLTGAEEVPAVTTQATGDGKISIARDMGVTGSIKTKGIAGTMAPIHEGPAGKNGPPIITLTRSGDDTWTVPEGSKLTESQYASLKAGNLYVSEDSRGLIVQILAPDQPPGAPQRLTVEPPAWTATNAFTLTWELPFDRSGIAGAYVKLGAPPTDVGDGTFYTGTELTQVAGLSVPGTGAHSIYVWLRDGAGNADPANAASATLGYDPDPPGSPIDLVADPGDWSPADSFTLAWDNPPEVSGVITACYRLDAPPADAADSDACQDGADIQAIDGIPVFDSGQHRAYVWLVDAADADLATGSVALRYDACRRCRRRRPATRSLRDPVTWWRPTPTAGCGNGPVGEKGLGR